MNKLHHEFDLRTRIKQLYPFYTAKELDEAEESLRQYVDIAIQIAERVRHDPDAYETLKALTNGQ